MCHCAPVLRIHRTASSTRKPIPTRRASRTTIGNVTDVTNVGFASSSPRQRVARSNVERSFWYSHKILRRKEEAMTQVTHSAIKLFQFPRMFGIPNISPFCCKLETWLRITKIPYDVVDLPDPRKGPKGKVPFIEDVGQRLGDSSAIVAI